MAEITLQMYLVQIIFVVSGLLTPSPLNHLLKHLGIYSMLYIAFNYSIHIKSCDARGAFTPSPSAAPCPSAEIGAGTLHIFTIDSLGLFQASWLVVKLNFQRLIEASSCVFSLLPLRRKQF